MLNAAVLRVRKDLRCLLLAQSLQARVTFCCLIIGLEPLVLLW